jgi:DMSO/TMAO reductase YedYZ molybdopterin-dependent catalytic subunit
MKTADVNTVDLTDPVRPPTAAVLLHPRRRGVAAGLIAAATGLAAGELLSAMVDDLTSPIIGVGNRIVDLVPVPLKTFAIRTFGTHDKEALLIGIASVLTIAAMIVGLVAVRRPRLGAAGISLFGIVGAIAAVTGRTGTAVDALPSLLAAVVGGIVLMVLVRTARSPRTQAGKQPDAGRRTFLISATTLAAAAAAMVVVGRVLRASAQAVAERARGVLPAPVKSLSPIPSTAGVTELVEVTPFITPNKDFYRIDTALVVPSVDVNKWSLTINGMVDKPLTFTYEDLLSRALVERDITLTCVSNEVGGVLMGTARWLGIPLKELLVEAGARPEATQIVGHSVDGWTSGFPTAVLDQGSDAIVALGMNGEALPFAHGFPARLVVPGLYGYVSATKWLNRIELTTLEEVDAYWVPRGYAKEAPIKLASRIDVPRGLSTVPAGRTAIAGIAWSQTIGISKVEVKIDGGEWQAAELADEQSIDTWRQWKFEWDATIGQHEITVRAYDKNGKVQIEERKAPLPNGATGWHQIVVFVS